MHQNFSEYAHICISSPPDPRISLAGEGCLRSLLGHQVCCAQAVRSEPMTLYEKNDFCLGWVEGGSRWLANTVWVP